MRFSPKECRAAGCVHKPQNAANQAAILPCPVPPHRCPWPVSPIYTFRLHAPCCVSTLVRSRFLPLPSIFPALPVTAAALRRAGCTVAQLRLMLQCTASELRAAGVPIVELQGEFTPAELSEAGVYGAATRAGGHRQPSSSRLQAGRPKTSDQPSPRQPSRPSSGAIATINSLLPSSPHSPTGTPVLRPPMRPAEYNRWPPRSSPQSSPCAMSSPRSSPLGSGVGMHSTAATCRPPPVIAQRDWADLAFLESLPARSSASASASASSASPRIRRAE